MLTNPRHEAFAVLVAGGARPAGAYTRAGFSQKGAAQSANRLAKVPSVAARIAELRQSVSDSVGHPLTRARLDREWVIDLLKTNALAAFNEGNRAAVNRAAELLGKELGMFRENEASQLPWDGDLRKLSMPQLEKLVSSTKSMLSEADPDAPPLDGSAGEKTPVQ